MNVLVTGIAGLLGSRLATWILDNTDCNVIGIDDLSGGFIENVDNRVTFHKLNLVTDIEQLDEIFKSENPIDSLKEALIVTSPEKPLSS